MREIEIAETPLLSPTELTMLRLHSIHNIFSVIIGQLEFKGLKLADDPELFAAALDLARRFLATVRHASNRDLDPADIASFKNALRKAVGDAVRATQLRDPERVVDDTMEAIDAALSVLEVRIRELAARSADGADWVNFDVGGLRDDLVMVFKTIGLCSNGRYEVTFAPGTSAANAYRIDFSVIASGTTISLPESFPDVVRDLIANARKYSRPGSLIRAELRESAAGLEFHVMDEGIGIPEAELETVIGFGKTASNTAEAHRMGFGGGLTKAVWVTKQAKGRFWISSAKGFGTQIRISIPKPRESADGAVRAEWHKGNALPAMAGSLLGRCAGLLTSGAERPAGWWWHGAFAR